MPAAVVTDVILRGRRVRNVIYLQQQGGEKFGVSVWPVYWGNRSKKRLTEFLNQGVPVNQLMEEVVEVWYCPTYAVQNIVAGAGSRWAEVNYTENFPAFIYLFFCYPVSLQTVGSTNQQHWVCRPTRQYWSHTHCVDSTQCLTVVGVTTTEQTEWCAETFGEHGR